MGKSRQRTINKDQKIGIDRDKDVFRGGAEYLKSELEEGGGGERE
jgi:hypothetical protein